jgi:hypothetical protein
VIRHRKGLSYEEALGFWFRLELFLGLSLLLEFR